MQLAALLQPRHDLGAPALSPLVGSPREGALRRYIALAVATAGGVGFAPIAPGTFGSLIGVALFVALTPGGVAATALAVIALASVGVWAAGEAEEIFGRHDDGRIVIDEIAGQLVALCPLTVLVPPERATTPLPLVLGFLAFRGFDIVKPGPIRWAQSYFSGGRGVVFDDLLAGAGAACVVAAATLAGIVS